MNKWLDSTVDAYKHYFGKTEEPVVWEVGSRDGHDGVELARRIYKGKDDWFWSKARVVCLEPNPDQLKIIRKNYPEAEVLEIAASNSAGWRNFMVYHGDEGAVGSSSLNLKWKEGDLDGHRIRVVTSRLDALLDDGPVDIMAIDTEGHSMEVLEGLGNKLHQVKVYYIETEVWTGSYDRVKTFMKSKGYTLVSEDERWGGMPECVFVNTLFRDDSVA